MKFLFCIIVAFLVVQQGTCQRRRRDRALDYADREFSRVQQFVESKIAQLTSNAQNLSPELQAAITSVTNLLSAVQTLGRQLRRGFNRNDPSMGLEELTTDVNAFVKVLSSVSDAFAAANVKFGARSDANLSDIITYWSSTLLNTAQSLLTSGKDLYMSLDDDAKEGIMKAIQTVVRLVEDAVSDLTAAASQ